MIKGKTLLVHLLIPLGTGGLSALLTMDAMRSYALLRHPPLSPPGWIFPVVWTILFVLMGCASYLVWMRDSTGRTGALVLYGVQLAFNFAWTLIFFNLQNYKLASFWILALWVLILLTVIRFFRETAAAGWLLIPYQLWTSFAVYLTAGVWFLNR